MKIDEAIAHSREVAEDNRSAVDNFLVDGYKEREMCLQCAEEHEQLVAWLEELKELRKFKESFTDLCKLYSEIRTEVIDDVIRKLAESENIILSDRQYYTLMELKEKK